MNGFLSLYDDLLNHCYVITMVFYISIKYTYLYIHIGSTEKKKELQNTFDPFYTKILLD